MALFESSKKTPYDMKQSAKARPPRRKKTSEKDLIDTLIEDWAAERPDLDASAMAIVGRLLILGRRLDQRVAARLKPYGLQYSDFDVLATLRRSGAPFELTPKNLMQSVLLTSGAMTALLDRLIKRGFIRRGKDKSDGRVRTAILTAKGKKLVDKAIKARFEEAQEAVADLSAAERRRLSKSLKEIAQRLQELDEEA